jgi:hypothetical protein
LVWHLVPAAVGGGWVLGSRWQRQRPAAFTGMLAAELSSSSSGQGRIGLPRASHQSSGCYPASTTQVCGQPSTTKQRRHGGSAQHWHVLYRLPVAWRFNLSTSRCPGTTLRLVRPRIANLEHEILFQDTENIFVRVPWLKVWACPEP